MGAVEQGRPLCWTARLPGFCSGRPIYMPRHGTEYGSVTPTQILTVSLQRLRIPPHRSDGNGADPDRMKRPVCLVGRDLSRLVAYSLALRDQEYAVTLIEAQDVLPRAAESAQRDGAWVMALLWGDEAPEACEALAPSQGLVLFVTPASGEALRRELLARDVPVIAEHEGPLPAVATLMAITRWVETQTEVDVPRPLTPGSAS